MRELRFDPLAGAWVLVAPERGARPGSGRRRPRPWPTSAWVATCPFCPGNEHLTPPEVARVAGGPDGPAWLARAIPNRYPIVSGAGAGAAPAEAAGALLRSRHTGGAHEVVVLSPRHDDALGAMAAGHAGAALGLLRDRMGAHLAAGRRSVQVFVNHEPEAGASLDHPHAQLVAMDVVAPAVEREAAVLAGAGCALCTAIETECQPFAPRVVLDGEVAAWCPFWSSAPFELLVAPRAHEARFEAAPGAAGRLAGALVALLAGLDRAAGDPAYNVVLHSAPAGAPDFHWHAHVRPRLSEPGGFELGTGIMVVELAPEDAARALRAARGRAGGTDRW